MILQNIDSVNRIAIEKLTKNELLSLNFRGGCAIIVHDETPAPVRRAEGAGVK